MPRVALAAIAALAALAIASSSACSSSSSSSPSPADDAGPTPAGLPRSFQRDVLPVLAGACARSDCHGDPNNAKVLIHFLVSEPDAVYMELRRQSVTAKGLALVEPGAPAKSFLYAKINGDEGDFSAMCGTTGCGDSMPPGTKIDSTQRDTIKAWITEGASKN